MNELKHYGVKGMRWGKTKRGQRDSSYRSTGIRSAIAKRNNKNVDKSFTAWKENSDRRKTAIDSGKKMNIAKMQLESDRKNKAVKSEYKKLKKDYNKAVKKNTTYRKGQIKEEVGKDLSRKYLSAAKKIKGTNQKQYSKLMNKYDVERDRARKAPIKAAKRSKAKANVKRNMTMTLKSAAATGLIVGGVAATNYMLNKHQVKRNGADFRFSESQARNFADAIKVGKDILGFF